MSQLPRGIRNNNPLNIRRGAGRFIGEVPLSKNTDPEFRQFHKMDYGIRAAFCLLRTYDMRYGITTVEGIIRRWAPKQENNTEEYISAVCKRLGWEPQDKVEWFRPEAVKLLWAMSIVETGQELPQSYFSDTQYKFVSEKISKLFVS